MSRALLGEASLYRGDKPHERVIQLPNGTSGTFYIRDLREIEVEAYFEKQRAGGEQQMLAEIDLCVAAIMEPDGETPSLDTDHASRLKMAVRKRLVHAILEVNGFIDAEKAGN